MVTIKIDQKSLNRTIKDLDKLSNEKHEKAFEIVAIAAWTISSKAVNNAPFISGRLQASIHAEHKDNTSWGYSCKVGSFEGGLGEKFIGNLGHNIGSNVEYAGFVHDGTSKQKANPFLSVPYYQEKPKMLAKLKKLVNEKWQ